MSVASSRMGGLEIVTSLILSSAVWQRAAALSSVQDFGVQRSGLQIVHMR